MNKKFRLLKTNKDNRESIRYVLNRDNRSFYGVAEGFMVRCSANETKSIISDARCERQRNGSSIPVYSQSTIENKRKLNRLMYLNGQRCYQPLLEKGASVLKDGNPCRITDYLGRNEYDEPVYRVVNLSNGTEIDSVDYELEPVIGWL